MAQPPLQEEGTPQAPALPVQRIFEYFPDLSPAQQQQFTALMAVYAEWNAQINVVSRKDIGALYEKHVLHSLGIAKAIQFVPGTRVLDLGTGGGFPGIPLAIMFPECHFHLTDSIGKKIKVVQEVVQALGLSNVVAEQIRTEKVKQRYDFVVTRAVARMNKLYQWTRYKVLPDSKNSLYNGILALKGGTVDEEMQEAGLNYQEFDLSQFFTEPFFETKKLIYVPLV